jgi:hypothetical protein
MPSYSSQDLGETAEIVRKLDPETLENIVDLLADVRARSGRLFSSALAAVRQMRFML